MSAPQPSETSPAEPVFGERTTTKLPRHRHRQPDDLDCLSVRADSHKGDEEQKHLVAAAAAAAAAAAGPQEGRNAQAVYEDRSNDNEDMIENPPNTTGGGGVDHRHLHFLLDEDEARAALLRESDSKARQVTNLRADPWRFAVAPIFALLSVSNAMQWIAFSPIVNEVRDFFRMNATQVNFLATTYVIAYVAIVFLSCKLYEVTGIKNGVMVAAAANALGALLKIIALYAWPHAALLYIAQVFNSFTEVLTIATPPLIANRWFPESERMVANTIMSSALNFGCGIGVLIPTFFVTPEKQEKRHFANFFWFHFAICFFALVLVIFLFPRKPRYAASFAADRQQHKEEERLRYVREAFHLANSSNHQTDEDCTTASASAADEAMVEVVKGSKGSGSGAVTDRTNRNDAVADAVPDDSDALHTTTFTATHGTHCGPRRRNRKHRKMGSSSDGHNDTTDSLADGDETTTTASSADREVEPVNVFSVLLDCARQIRYNYSFALLMLAAAAELGLIWAVATVLPQMLMPYGISESTSGWIGFLNLVLGTVVCPFMMPLVERFGRRYKLLLCSLAVVLTVNMVTLTLVLHFGPTNSDGSIGADNKYYVIATFVCWGAISGLCQNFMMPLMFEYVVELTFPMAESTSAPALTWAACLTNFVLTLVFGEVLTNYPDEGKALRVFIGSAVVTAVGAVSLFLTKPMHKRRDYEQTKREEQTRLAEELEELRVAMAGEGGPGNATAVGGATSVAVGKDVNSHAQEIPEEEDE